MQLPLFNQSHPSGDGQLRRARGLRLDMRSLFSGTSGTGPSLDSPSPSGRKNPRVGFQAIPQVRLDSPHLHRIARPTRSFSDTAGIQRSGIPRAGNRTYSSLSIPSQARTTSSRSHVGFGPEDRHLAALARDGRRHRERRRLERERSQTRSRCFRRIRHPLVRRKLFYSLISGTVLATILTICTCSSPLP